MRIAANLEVSMQIVEKLGKFYAQAWDIESMNLVFETDCLTHQGAACALADFVMESLSAKRNK